MKSFTETGMVVLILLLVFAVETASASETVEINAIGTNYEYEGWSEEQYPVINLFGEKYVPLFINSGNTWNCRVDKLAKLVLDSDINYTLNKGSKLELGEGYTLEAKQFDVDGNKVWLEFSKDGQYIDDYIISVSGDAAEKTWTVNLDNIQNENDIVVMKVHVNQIIPGVSGSIAQIDGIWLIDYSNVRQLKLEDEIGAFELTEISGNKLFFEYMSDQPAPNEIRITTCESLKGYPSIYGDRIIWADWRDELGIFMYDLSTSTETQITTNESRNDAPAIYGDRIVWQSSSIENWDNADLYMLNLSTSEKTRITNDSSHQQDSAIYGDKIVWTDWRNDNGNWSNGDIYMYNLSTSTETQITSDGSCQDSPAIYGDKIVWTDWRNDNGNWSNGDIYLYDLSTSTETQVTNNGARQYDPVIYGDKIVWSDRRNGEENSDIYMYDLSTFMETQITNNESNQYSPAIYDDRIAWTDERNGELDELGHIVNSDIYMYDLSTSTEARITTNMADQMEPAIYMDRIVWMDKRNGDMGHYSMPEVYMSTISGAIPTPELPVASFTINVTTGYYPLFVNFTDISKNATGRNWDFENDGIVDYTDTNPVHTYTVPGEYIVKLIAFNANGINSKLATVTVLGKKVLPVANFSSNVTEGYAPLTVQFMDRSALNELHGSMPSEQQVITEAKNGTNISLKNGENFTLRLRENPSTGYSWQLNLSGGLKILNEEYVQDSAPEEYTGVPGTHSWIIEAVAQGTQQVNGIYKRSWENTTGMEEKFTLNVISVSSDELSRFWNFGDGTNSTQENPIHTYSTAGNYTVSLTTTNAAGSNTSTKSGYVKVTAAYKAPIASFTSNVSSGKVPLTVKFTDTSSGSPTAWKWNFGDGTYSTAKNPKHQYTRAGKYTVSLTVKNAAGSNTIKKISYINTTNSLDSVGTLLNSLPSEKAHLTMQFFGNIAGLHRARH